MNLWAATDAVFAASEITGVLCMLPARRLRFLHPTIHPAAVLSAEGPLHAAEAARLRAEVQGLLRRGERRIVVCLASVSAVDAAGIGELVRAYNIAAAWSGTLRVSDARGKVRELLDRVGLLKIMTADV